MIEDVLRMFEAEGYLVSNVFQVPPNNWVFGDPGWQVYLRNSRNNRTGSCVARTLEGALQGALDAARAVPLLWERGTTRPLDAPPTLPRAFRAPILDADEGDASGDLF